MAEAAKDTAMRKSQGSVQRSKPVRAGAGGGLEVVIVKTAVWLADTRTVSYF